MNKQTSNSNNENLQLNEVFEGFIKKFIDHNIITEEEFNDVMGLVGKLTEYQEEDKDFYTYYKGKGNLPIIRVYIDEDGKQIAKTQKNEIVSNRLFETAPLNSTFWEVISKEDYYSEDCDEEVEPDYQSTDQEDICLTETISSIESRIIELKDEIEELKNMKDKYLRELFINEVTRNIQELPVEKLDKIYQMTL